jgi:hypothetical protein
MAALKFEVVPSAILVNPGEVGIEFRVTMSLSPGDARKLATTMLDGASRSIALSTDSTGKVSVTPAPEHFPQPGESDDPAGT